MLLDPDREWTVTVEDGFHRQPWTAYEGKRMKGRVIRTLRRSETLFDDARDGRDRIVAKPGSGRFLPRGRGAAA